MLPNSPGCSLLIFLYMRSGVVLVAVVFGLAAPIYQLLSPNLSLFLSTSATIEQETSSSLPAATSSISASNHGPHATTSNASVSTAFPDPQRLGKMLLSNDNSSQSNWECTHTLCPFGSHPRKLWRAVCHQRP